jgi:putative transposase
MARRKEPVIADAILDQLLGGTDARSAFDSNGLIDQLKKALAERARGHFHSDEAATKLLYLVLNRSEKEWKMPPREWAVAKSQLAPFGPSPTAFRPQGRKQECSTARPYTKFLTVPFERLRF